MNIGEIIKNRRKELGLSAEEVADMIGASPATIYRYESNYITKMGIDKLTPIANALRVSEAYLMGWTTDPNWRPASDILPASSGSSLQLTDREEHLVISFRGLNEDGREKAIERVEELLDVPRYRQVSLQEDVDQIVGDVLGQSEKLKRG